MVDNVCSSEERKKVLDELPQKPPFRFLDEIVELSTEHIVATYTFKHDEYFYQGHFPGDPITPGVIMVEAMAQAGLVALGLYLIKTEGREGQLRTLFTECQVEFMEVVRPGALVTIRAQRDFWRRNKLKSKAELVLENGKVAAAGILSGVGVPVSAISPHRT